MTSPALAAAPSSLPSIFGIDVAGLKCAMAGAAARVVPASALGVRPAPETVSFGIAELDELAGGVPRGSLTELYGPASAGRTGVLLTLMAEMTRQQEVCALVDASDSFDPASAEAARVDLRRLLWIRCRAGTPQRQGDTEKVASSRSRSQAAQDDASKLASVRLGNGQRSHSRKQIWQRLEQVLKATDLLLQSGGFGLVAIDLGDVFAEAARCIPLASWFRFRRAVENTRTVLLVIGQDSCAKTCASLVLKLSGQFSAANCSRIVNHQAPIAGQDLSPGHARLLCGLEIQAELIRTRTERKPVRPADRQFVSRTAWVG